MASLLEALDGGRVTLRECQLRDQVDALDAEEEAKQWEHDGEILSEYVYGHACGRPPAKLIRGRMRMRRLGQNRLCGRDTMYCPHKPACPR